MSEHEHRDYRDRIRARLESVYGREPRWRYFKRTDGALCYWTTEKAGRDGKYISGVYVPEGADAFRQDREQESRHRLRRDAKARALKLSKERVS